jgi:hypothetical protein
MNGIVERLRGLKAYCSNDDCEVCETVTDAADAIEALCEALDLLYRKTVVGADAERHDALDKAGTLLARLQS